MELQCSMLLKWGKKKKRKKEKDVLSVEYDDMIKCFSDCTLFTDEEKAAYITEAKEKKKKAIERGN